MGDMVLNAIEEMSVVDVYDLASDIGKECEKIIDLFGADSVTALMPKVITVLELLEAMATRNESENTRMQELSDRIAHLESEKQEKALFRERFEKELEAIEEQWRSETNDLMAMVNRLQDENRRILKYQQSSQQNENDSSINEMGTSLPSPSKHHQHTRNNHQQQQQQQQQLTTNLDDQINSSNLSNVADFQVLQRLRGQIDKHRNELKAKEQDLQTKCLEVENLSVQLERVNNNGRESRKRQKLLQVQVRSLVEERADFLAQLQDQHREIMTLKKRLGIAEKENEDLSHCSDEVDPHRARFTTAELKEILTERDELKLQIIDLEEELKTYKPPEELKVEEKSTEEDPPVQGPLPYEPDDAPWKKTSESGIRKFFRKLFSEPGTTNFPRRSLSTLSKMALSSSHHSENI